MDEREVIKSFKKTIDEYREEKIDYMNFNKTKNGFDNILTSMDTMVGDIEADSNNIADELREHKKMLDMAGFDYNTPEGKYIETMRRLIISVNKSTTYKSIVIEILDIFINKYYDALDEVKGIKMSSQLIEHQEAMLAKTREHNEEMNKVNQERFMVIVDKLFVEQSKTVEEIKNVHKDSLYKLETERRETMKDFFIAMASGKTAVEEYEKQKRIEDMRKEQEILQAKKSKVIYGHAPVEDEVQAPLPTKVDVNPVQNDKSSWDFDEDDEENEKEKAIKQALNEKIREYLDKHFKFDKEKINYLLDLETYKDEDIVEILGCATISVYKQRKEWEKINKR